MDAADTKVWFVTGASSGLGRALVEAVLSRGGSAIATARDPEAMVDLEQRYGEKILTARLDVTRPEDARMAAEAGLAAFGRIDVLVNNAGYGLFGAFEELSIDDLRHEFETNVFGSINVTRAILPCLRQQGFGSIVQISSLEGIAPMVAGEVAYASTKFAAEGIAEALARETSSLGMRVMIVEPGPLRTSFAAGAVAARPVHDDYEEGVGQALDWFERIAGHQPNDPARVAAAIIQALEADDPPLRLALGGEAVDAIRDKLERQLRELETWDFLSRTTAFASSG